MERFIIIDGNAILHRAFHAMPPLTTSSGRLVNAVYGFASMLFKLKDGFNPVYMAVTFDLPKPTFRKKIFTEYQIKRPKMDEGLVSQVELVKDMVRALGIPIYEKEGFEADDVIGTLAFQANVPQDQKSKIPPSSANGLTTEGHGKNQRSDQRLETIIVTGDRDILQLVDDTVKVYMPTKGITEAVLYDKDKVKEKFGIPPELIPDYKGLVGDQSDNYPGVGGIGPKTAEDLLKKYGSFPEIYRRLEEVKDAIRDKLLKGKEGGEMSYTLATIIKDAPVELELEKCKVSDFNKPEVIEFLEKMEFRSLIKRLRGTTGSKSITGTTGKRTKNEKLKTKDENENQMSLF